MYLVYLVFGPFFKSNLNGEKGNQNNFEDYFSQIFFIIYPNYALILLLTKIFNMFIKLKLN